MHHQLEVAAVIERMYLNSSLLKTDVIAEMEYGKKTLAKEYLSEVGFYNFVNAYRLKHAQCYKERYPKATLDEVATTAGFRDRPELCQRQDEEQRPASHPPFLSFH